MNFSRKEFIKITTFTGIAFLLKSCGIHTEEDNNNDSQKKDSTKLNESLEVYKKIDSENVLYITKQNKDYDSLRQGFNKKINKYPAIIALCLNTKGVQEAVLCAKEHKLKIAIKSGGHCFEGFSSNMDGMVINLSKLNSVEFLDEDTIKVEAGCKLGELYEKLLIQNKIIPAGSCSGVGVGGLTLGGGYGLFSRKHGLTCDSIVELEIVNAEGKLLTSKDHPELLWALKGGGNGNYGVVTQFLFRTHPAPNFFQSTRFKAHKLDVERTLAIMKLWFQIAEHLPDDCFSAFVLNGKALTILITNFEELTPETETLYEELSKLTDSYKKGGKLNVASALKVFGGQTSPILFNNASVGLYNNFDDISEVIPHVINKVINGKGLIYQINTLGGKIMNEDFKATSSFPYRSCKFLSELQSYWQNEDKNEFYINQFSEIQALFYEAGINKQYINYPSLNNPTYETSYYGDNYEKLQSLKSIYDPDNLFCHSQSIKPK
ncbi:MAG: FAD-binding oxidoreductase [Bacteroidia bacterium]|nr:FAD-binding oxidoreductase [Bacteroidia bacterium]